MRTIHGMEDLLAAEGEELGVSSWHEVTQGEIDAFASTTGDDYWIHTSPEKAADGPLGTTIAHGLLTLALGPTFLNEIVEFEGFSLRLNYGYDKVRFPSPVPVGSRVRMRCELESVQRNDGSAQAVLRETFETDGAERPPCVARHVLHLVG
jgi:acyl dehydratase